MFDQISGDCGLAKMTHKTNRQRDLALEFTLEFTPQQISNPRASVFNTYFFCADFVHDCASSPS